MADKYKILGVPKGSSEKDIRRAYRNLARKYHPDLNPGDKNSEERFKQINEAYEVLSNTDSRRKYDLYGDQWKHADQFEQQQRRGGASPSGPFRVNWGRSSWGRHADGFPGLQDLFSGRGGNLNDFTGSHTQRNRPEAAVTVSLEESFGGTEVTASLTVSGHKHRYRVKIPPGVDNGSVVRISPENQTDILINVTVSSHPRFTRKGNDLYVEADIPFEDAILGGETKIQTLDGRQIWVRVPAQSQNGQHIRLRGQGMPNLKFPTSKGDLFVKVHPSLPKETSNEEKTLLRKLRGLRAEKSSGP
ncbi:DnaJ domain-containing protein [Dehalococcoidia bacterium]|nr:DnaJ domain-containing protein [Dehalococcoidia bacterium]